MSEKINIDLGSIQVTLLLPLWGRAMETQKRNPSLTDKTAFEIINKIDYDFTRISNNIHSVTQYEWIARSIHIDRTIKEFLLKYPKAAIVNIGCRLDTTFERVDNGKLYWYDLDLPDVIDLRRKFIPEGERNKFISCSFLDESWFKGLHIEDNVLFIAAGVLYYFEENQLKDIFNKIASSFPESEFVFDAASSVGVKIANKKVIESSGLDQRSYLTWGLDTASELSKWNNKIVALISDHYKIMYMVHLKILKS